MQWRAVVRQSEAINMYKNRTLPGHWLVTSTLACALAACGSNGTVVTRMDGTAATGQAIANSALTLKDSNGRTAHATSDANGRFSFNVESLRAPVVIKASAASGAVYAVVGANELNRQINVTPLSHAVVKMALGAADDAAIDTAFDGGSFDAISATAIARADAALLTLLRAEFGTQAGVSDSATNLRFTKFTPASATQDGDEIDRLLTLFQPAVGASGFVALNRVPELVNAVTVIRYDGVSDDLLTAGMGASGLAGAAPGYATATSPTAAELRKSAIYNNYRAVLDINANSGYGTLYGPNVDKNGVVTPLGASVGLIGGKEYIAYADDGSGQKNVTLMVQIPSSFDKGKPCIVTGTSSGSRGIYGAIGSAGEWGLKHGCAVAYTDKGSGTGLYTFDTDQVNARNGLRVARAAAGSTAIFTPKLTDAQRSAYNAGFPGRIASKHAHSQQNPEKDWGRNTLQAVAFAFYALNEEYGTALPGQTAKQRAVTPANTVVIASSISNGAGAALLAAEQDRLGLIKGVAASEPQIQSHGLTGFTVQQGGVAVPAQAKSLYDYSSFAALYQPCLHATAVGTSNANRCNSLQAKGLLTGSLATDAPTLAALQTDARNRMHAYGWLADSDPLLNLAALGGNFGNAVYVGWSNLMVTATYAYAYGQFAATDHVCGFSFANLDASGLPVAFGASGEAASFASGSGILGGLVYENSVGGAKVFALGTSPSTGVQDQSLDGFLCMRALATGLDPVSHAALTGPLATQSQRVQAGMAAVQASGNLHGKPSVIVQGRADTLIPVNHAARAYLGLNAQVEGASSQLRYIEVTNANHFDTNASAMPAVIVPLHVYLFRALDAVYANLSQGTALPPSQVVRTKTRAANTTPITTAEHLPLIAATPAAADSIALIATTVNVPN
jgi:hydroxybutyrate-dimer hydrolase